MSLLRSLFARSAPPPPDGRRQFVRRAAGMGALAVGGGLLLPDEAWAGVEERAARFDITPGTVVDAQGRPVATGSQGQDPFLGAVVMYGFTFPPRGWAFCNGQLLPIAQNTALFALLGTTYGGNGQTTFALPDLQGRLPMQSGAGPGLTTRALGQKTGQETVTLSTQQMPAHTHTTPPLSVSSATGTTDDPTGAVPARPASGIATYSATPDTPMAAPAGGGQAHPNLPPYLVVNFCIALQGVFPSRP